jgi:aspartate/methionine/tyrosine aminotransferase
MGLRVPDVIGLWAGEPDLATPDFICEAASKALLGGETFYSENRGIPELRAAIADYHQHIHGVTIADERIAATSSGMNAVQLVAQAVVSPGDNVIVATPSWPNIMRAMEISGAAIRQIPIRPSNDGWRLDIGQVMAARDPRTRILYLASPANPTGWMIDRTDAEALLAFARAQRIAIIADEVYHRIVFERKAAFSFLEICQADDPVFVINSFSKAWAMTGWRMGWLIYPAGMTDTFEKLIQFNTSGGQAFLQRGAIVALKEGEDFVAEFVERCRSGRDIVNERLAAMPKVRNVPSNGTFYTMFEVDGVRDSLAFCKRALTDARIGLAPGMAFGAGAESFIRLCYAKSPENLSAAMDRLATFLETGPD